jgi:protein-L-isoaspartate O-methyltransferase
VTLLDNWGNGGKDFTRTIPFDKLSRLMSRAQVDAARAEGRLIHETERGFGLLSADPAPVAPVAPLVANLGELTDEKLRAARSALEAGVQVVTANQLFPTPPELAARVVEAAQIRAHHTVLEPSAGTGRLIEALPDGPQILAVEINAALVEQLRARFLTLRDAEQMAVLKGDFLTMYPDHKPTGLGLFDRVVMNPPFERGADIKHIQHAARFLRPGGRLVAICAAGPRQEKAMGELGATWEPLGAGLFEGTGVAVALVTYDAPEPQPERPAAEVVEVARAARAEAPGNRQLTLV